MGKPVILTGEAHYGWFGFTDEGMTPNTYRERELLLPGKDAFIQFALSFSRVVVLDAAAGAAVAVRIIECPVRIAAPGAQAPGTSAGQWRGDGV